MNATQPFHHQCIMLMHSRSSLLMKGYLLFQCIHFSIASGIPECLATAQGLELVSVCECECGWREQRCCCSWNSWSSRWAFCSRTHRADENQCQESGCKSDQDWKSSAIPPQYVWAVIQGNKKLFYNCVRVLRLAFFFCKEVNSTGDKSSYPVIFADRRVLEGKAQIHNKRESTALWKSQDA